MSMMKKGDMIIVCQSSGVARGRDSSNDVESHGEIGSHEEGNDATSDGVSLVEGGWWRRNNFIKVIKTEHIRGASSRKSPIARKYL